MLCLQSCWPGCCRPAPNPAAKGTPPLNAHTSTVTGLSLDSCNRLLVSVSLGGELCTWDFPQRRQQSRLAVGSPVTHLAHQPATALVAVACQDLSVRM